MLTAKRVAYFLLERSSSDGIPISHQKLQKLALISHCYHLCVHSQPLFDDPVQAWDGGPILTEIYNDFYEYGKAAIPVEKETVASKMFNMTVKFITGDKISQKELDSLEKIWNIYKNHDGDDLAAHMVEKNSPWDIVWNQLHNNGNLAFIPNGLLQLWYQQVFFRTSSSQMVSLDAPETKTEPLVNLDFESGVTVPKTTII